STATALTRSMWPRLGQEMNQLTADERPALATELGQIHHREPGCQSGRVLYRQCDGRRRMVGHVSRFQVEQNTERTDVGDGRSVGIAACGSEVVRGDLRYADGEIVDELGDLIVGCLLPLRGRRLGRDNGAKSFSRRLQLEVHACADDTEDKGGQ